MEKYEVTIKATYQAEILAETQRDALKQGLEAIASDFSTKTGGTCRAMGNAQLVGEPVKKRVLTLEQFMEEMGIEVECAI